MRLGRWMDLGMMIEMVKNASMIEKDEVLWLMLMSMLMKLEKKKTTKKLQMVKNLEGLGLQHPTTLSRRASHLWTIARGLRKKRAC